jgi:hypothetical protein
MKPFVTLQLEDDTIRFTPDGRIAVVDAISALSETDCPDCVWEDLKRSHPQLGGMYNDYSFTGKERVPVASSENWDFIQTLLLERLIDSES